MNPYRVAIIGTGRVGYQFSFGGLPDNHAEAVALHPRFELVAGVNRGREKLEAFGDRFGVSALHHDYKEMLDQVGPTSASSQLTRNFTVKWSRPAPPRRRPGR